MSAKRFFMTGAPAGELVALDKEALRHARVSRLRDGEAVELMDGRGNFWRGVFENNGVRIQEVGCAQRPVPEIILVIGLTQGTMEDIVRQATELGVSAIVPLICDNSAAFGDAARAESKRERWEKIAQEACKQSGNYFTPDIFPLTKFEDALEMTLAPASEQTKFLSAGVKNETLNLVAALGQETISWREVAETLRVALARRIFAWVGSEGDFSPGEYQKLKEAGAKFVSLGNYVLRTETACVAMLAGVRNMI